MDLASGGKKLMVMMLHTTKEGNPRILRQCTFPLTARNCVSRIFTDIAVIDVTKQGLVLREVAPDWTAEEVQALTEPRLIIDENLREIEL
jgi:3-oxoacid CoA-transferase B subunit